MARPPAGLSVLTPREMLSLFDALPYWTLDPDSAVTTRLQSWRSAHPELAAKYPATEVMRRVFERR
jgi:hypothetical protein